MKLGDIVYLKQYPAMIGEVVGINDMDIITVSLCDTRLKITVAMCDLGITESLQPNRYPSSVNILGVKYKIIILTEDDYRYDKDTDGWCDPFAKEILLYNYKQSVDSVKDLKAYQKKVLRHEIVHAFLYESGLWQNSHSSTCWAKNEEMVDWLAIQEPKLHRAFKEAGCDE